MFGIKEHASPRVLRSIMHDIQDGSRVHRNWNKNWYSKEVALLIHGGNFVFHLIFLLQKELLGRKKHPHLTGKYLFLKTHILREEEIVEPVAQNYKHGLVFFSIAEECLCI